MYLWIFLSTSGSFSARDKTQQLTESAAFCPKPDVGRQRRGEPPQQGLGRKLLGSCSFDREKGRKVLHHEPDVRNHAAKHWTPAPRPVFNQCFDTIAVTNPVTMR